MVMGHVGEGWLRGRVGRCLRCRFTLARRGVVVGAK